MELFDEVVPRTARNFLEIASGNNPQRFSYTGTIFHRIIPNFMLQVRRGETKLKIKFQMQRKDLIQFDAILC